MSKENNQEKSPKEEGALESSSKTSDAADFRSIARELSVKRGSIAPPGGLSGAASKQFPSNSKLPRAVSILSNNKNYRLNGEQGMESTSGRGVVVESRMELEGKANILIKVSSNNDMPQASMTRYASEQLSRNPAADDDIPDVVPTASGPAPPPATRRASAIVKKEPLVFTLPKEEIGALDDNTSIKDSGSKKNKSK